MLKNFFQQRFRKNRNENGGVRQVQCDDERIIILRYAGFRA